MSQKYLSCYAIIYESEDDNGNLRYYVTTNDYDHSILCDCVDFNDLDEIEPEFTLKYKLKNEGLK